MKKNYLLPHIYQNIGLCAMFLSVFVLVAYIAVCMYVAFECDDADSILSRTSRLTNGTYNLIHALVCIGVILFTFSREKYEDEMIDAVRKTSVVRAAYAVFMFYMAVMLLGCIAGLATGVDFDENELLSDLRECAEDPMIMFLFYEAFFRFKLAKLRKALRDEE